MGCIAALLALISPRLALFFIWLFSDLLGDAYDEWWIPLLGFFLLPWTTLAYAVMWVAGNNEVTGFEWFIVVLAFLLDISSWSQSGRIGRGDDLGSRTPVGIPVHADPVAGLAGRQPLDGRPVGADDEQALAVVARTPEHDLASAGRVVGLVVAELRLGELVEALPVGIEREQREGRAVEALERDAIAVG